MVCQINRDSVTNEIVSVNARNGAKSLLYEDLVNVTTPDNYIYDVFARRLIDTNKVRLTNNKEQLKKEVALIEWHRYTSKYTGTGPHYDANGEVKYSSLLTADVKPVANFSPRALDQAFEPYVEDTLEYDTPLAKTARTLSNMLGIKLHYISEQKAREMLSKHNVSLSNRTSFTLNNEVYIIHGRADMGTLVHELFHPMIEVIEKINPSLYEGLKKQITFEMYMQAAENTVDRNNVEDVYKEAMATYVGDFVRNNRQSVKHASFIERVFNFLSKVFSILKGSQVSITPYSTLEEIADSILAGTKNFNINDYVITADKLFFETRPDSKLLSSLKNDSASLTRSEDFKTYTNGTDTFASVGTVIDKFANISREEGELAIIKADKYWTKRGIPHDVKLNVSDYPHLALTYDEYIKQKQDDVNRAIAKGQILHAYREFALEKTESKRADIAKRIKELSASIGLMNPDEEFGWSISEDYGEAHTNLFKQITAIEGTNIGDRKVPDSIKDKVVTEVKVFSDVLKWAGTIDSLVESHDGLLSIVDLTTGRSYNSDFVGQMMKYGEQVYTITNTPKNRKKLQVMLYALIIKSQHPDAKFRHLKVHWMPNRFEAVRESQDMDIDIGSFLPMIEDYIRFEMPTTYKELVAKSPKIFDITEYGDVNRTLLDDMDTARSKGMSDQEYVSKLEQELTRMTNRLHMYNELQQKNYRLERDIIKLTKQIIQIKGNPAMLGLDTSRPDESMWKRFFGMFGDFADKKLQLFKLYLNSRRTESDREKAILRRQLDTITTELKEDYLSRTGKKALQYLTLGQINAISYDDLYGNMIVTVDVGTTAQRKVLVNETAHPDRWAALSETEKRFVKFIASKMDTFNQRIFMQNGTPRVSHESIYGKQETYLDVLKRSLNTTFTLGDPTFLPKVPMLAEELIERHGISKEFAKEYASDLTGDLLVNDFQRSRNDTGVPLRYFSNLEIDSSDKFTHNLEHAFLAFSENMIDKYYMDDALALANGIRLIYMHDTDAEGKVKQQNNLAFLEDRILIDILNRKDKSPNSRTGFRIPGTTRKLNEFALFRMLGKLVSAQIMWLKPVQGTANGIMAGLITTRRAAVTSILNAGAFGLKDTAFGIKQALELTGSAALGNVRNNKLFQIAQELNYLPTDFGYNTPSSDLTTAKNPGMSLSSMYMFHTGPEKFNALVVLAAQLHRMKTTVNGVETNMYDAYQLVEKTDPVTGVVFNTVEYVGDTRGLVKDGSIVKELRGLTSEEIAKMKRIYEKMQGGYRPDEKTTMELCWWGQIALQFRKYLPSIVMNALKSKTEDYTLGEYKVIRRENGQDVYEWVAASTEGSFRILGKALVALLTLGKKEQGYFIFGDDMPIERKEVLLDAFLVLLTAVAGMALLMKLYPDDDDEKDETNLLLWRILENYSQHYNPFDWSKTLKNQPAAVVRSFRAMQAFWEMSIAMGQLGLGNEDEAYTRYGRIKGGTELIKSVPVLASLYAFHKFVSKSDITEDSDVSKWFDANFDLAR